MGWFVDKLEDAMQAYVDCVDGVIDAVRSAAGFSNDISPGTSDSLSHGDISGPPIVYRDGDSGGYDSGGGDHYMF